RTRQQTPHSPHPPNHHPPTYPPTHKHPLLSFVVRLIILSSPPSVILSVSSPHTSSPSHVHTHTLTHTHTHTHTCSHTHTLSHAPTHTSVSNLCGMYSDVVFDTLKCTCPGL